MMIRIPDVLSAEQVAQCRQAMAQAAWADGRLTAGHLAAPIKHNLQLPVDDPLARQMGDLVLDALGRTPAFIAAALPMRILPPRFNRYEGGGDYGDHIDNAIFAIPGTPFRVRTDLSATLFLSDPDEYEGGELTVQDSYGSHAVKLPAGHMVLYPGTSLHHVTPVTAGTRYAAFFWTQSLVRHDHQRALLYQLDQSIQSLTAAGADHAVLSQLSGVYHNLLREWSDT